ncbi:MAG: hypothetical protein AB7H79_08460 [Sphingomonas sp.]
MGHEGPTRNAALSLLLGLAVAALGLGYIFWALASFDIGMRLGQLTPAATLPGFVAIGLGLWLALRAVLLLRLRNALLRGEGAIARWQVPAAEWEAWRIHDDARSASWSTLRNKLPLSAAPPPMEGVPVVIGAQAFVVGEAIVPLNVAGFGPFAIWQLCDVSLVEGPSPCLEYSRYIRGHSGPEIQLVRIPVGAAGRAGAQKAVDHFNATIPERHRAFARTTFPAHFRARDGDPAGADRAWRRDAPGRYALVAAILGVAVLGIWSGWFDGREAPALDPRSANLALAGALALLALAGLLALIGYRRRRR